MTSFNRATAVLNQLAVWLSSHPVAVQVAIIIAVVFALAAWSYSVANAMPLSGGTGGGCGC